MDMDIDVNAQSVNAQSVNAQSVNAQSVNAQSVNAQWLQFCAEHAPRLHGSKALIGAAPAATPRECVLPTATPLHISTQTIICFLNHQLIELVDVFWNLPILPYHLPQNGIVKKQMKFNLMAPAEVAAFSDKVAQVALEYPVEQHIISQISADQRRPFKDVRKVSVGLCQKNMTRRQCKKKSAFYNCFVVILRLLYKDTFKEVHVKVFNTGKLEIPGIQNTDILPLVLTFLTDVMRPLLTNTLNLAYDLANMDTVLINSNFSCGFELNRQKLHDILKGPAYRLHCNYDPCSYPGIQCEFHFDPTRAVQTGLPSDQAQKVSFMIFRTGSVLIVGKCVESTLHVIYNFLCAMFRREYYAIRNGETVPVKSLPALEDVNKRRKLRHKIVFV